MLLWNEGVSMFDAHTGTNFTLRVVIFAPRKISLHMETCRGIKLKVQKHVRFAMMK